LRLYKKILFCLDNSDDADAGVELGIRTAAHMGATATGCHVYAARLHDARFREMEGGLPGRYREPGELKRQREVHDDLITRGLELISDSYTSVFLARASGAGVDARGVSREGRNFSELVREAASHDYGLVVMGAHGLGRTDECRIGSVAERVARRVRSDVLMARGARDDNGRGAILVGIDGSPASFGALTTALAFSEVFSRPIEAVAVFDPHFHVRAFRSLAGVLTEEAGRLFRFKEQEAMHEEVIDRGLERIYKGHLTTASALARGRGVDIKTTLVEGKASAGIIRLARATSPFMLVLGRTGAYTFGDPESEAPEIGSVAENCMREAGCSVLITTSEETPLRQSAGRGEGRARWTDEAEAVLLRVPGFARGMVREMVEERAARLGIEEITPKFMRTVKKDMEE